MSKLKVAIVGRPNVGKSSLFNRLCGKRVAIVDEMVGVTRDRLYREADGFGTAYTLIDTGGIDPTGEIPFHEEVKYQAQLAIKEADRIILVVDGTMPPTHMDHEIARFLLRSGKKIILAVNKCDQLSKLNHYYEYYGLGIQEMIPISAIHGVKVADLIETFTREVPCEIESFKENEKVKIAIVGKPNVGKSTFLNQIMQEERSIVSPIPGTTRDSIDSDFTIHGKSYVLIDTAGIRRKRAEHEAVDKFATIRTERAIERADICLLVLDATQGITQSEKKILKLVESKKKGCILFLNKWDLVSNIRMEHAVQGLIQDAQFLKHCPIMVGSAENGRNALDLFTHAEEVYKHYHQRISTGKLNRFMQKVIQKYHPPMIRGKRLRIYYLTQISSAPPHFAFFVNYPDLMTDSYKKYIINQFRATYGFTGCPLTFDLRKREQKTARETDWSEEETDAVEQILETISHT